MIRLIHRFSFFIFNFIAAIMPIVFIIGTIVAASLSLVFQLDILQALVMEKHITWMFYGVIGMEVTKWALVFFTGLDDNPFKSKMLNTRGFLITLSVACSIFYCMHSLYNPQQNAVLDEKTAQVKELNSQEVERIIVAFDQEKEEIRSYYDQNLGTLFTLREKEKENVVRGSFEGPRFKSLQKEIGRLEDTLSARIAEVESRRKEALSMLSTELKKDLENAKNEASSFIEAGHPILVKALFTLNIGQEFSDMQYVLLVLILSLLVTGSIETIIYHGFTYLAKEVNAVHSTTRTTIKDVNLQKSVIDTIEGLYKTNAKLISSLSKFTQKNIATMGSHVRNLFKNQKNKAS